MDANQLPPITPEQRQAILAGAGAASFVEPETKTVYLVTPKTSEHPCEMPDDDAIRRELDEVRLNYQSNGGPQLSIQEVLVEARRQRTGEA